MGSDQFLNETVGTLVGVGEEFGIGLIAGVAAGIVVGAVLLAYKLKNSD
jgi:hypothetical protein